MKCWPCYLNGRGFREEAFTVLGGVALCEAHAALAGSKVMDGRALADRELTGLDSTP